MRCLQPIRYWRVRAYARFVYTRPIDPCIEVVSGPRRCSYGKVYHCFVASVGPALLIYSGAVDEHGSDAENRTLHIQACL